MKVTPEHLAVIREAVTPHDTPERRERYRTGRFPRADLVQDLDKRYRWDLFHVANDEIATRNRTEHRDPPTPFLSAVLYDAGYHDSHIDTALRAVVPALGTTPNDGKARHPFVASDRPGWDNVCMEPGEDDEPCGWPREDHQSV